MIWYTRIMKQTSIVDPVNTNAIQRDRLIYIAVDVSAMHIDIRFTVVLVSSENIHLGLLFLLAGVRKTSPSVYALLSVRYKRGVRTDSKACMRLSVTHLPS